MIKLSRNDAPIELDITKKEMLTKEFEASGKSVWNKNFIKEALLNSSHSKCAYCETKIDEESKYLEVEHFRCKGSHPALVVDWENLLPSCKRCNGNKGKHDVDVDGMIINPFVVDPKNHIYFHNYRLRWKDKIGRDTIDTLYLNDSDRLVGVRHKLGEAIAVSLETIRDQLEDFLGGARTTLRQRQITRGIQKLLDEAQPNAAYSALSATILLTDPNYIWIRANLQNEGLWDDLGKREEIILTLALQP